jgi:hypothetical protein
VMPHLQDVDVAEHTLVDERLKHHALGVSSQYRREARGARKQHHA